MPPIPFFQNSDWTTNSTFMAWIAVGSLVIGIVSIIISIWLYRRGKRQKRLEYRILSDTPVISIKTQSTSGQIKIIYENSTGQITPIENARLLSLQVRNVGKGDIEIPAWQDKKLEKNVELPIEFKFGGRTVVSLTEIKTSPSDIILPENLAIYLAAPSSTPQYLGLPRCLLKQGQSIKLGILLNGNGTETRWTGALADTKMIDIEEKFRRRRKFGVRLMNISSIILFLFGATLCSSFSVQGFISFLFCIVLIIMFQAMRIIYPENYNFHE